jgi:hypothetical protein
MVGLRVRRVCNGTTARDFRCSFGHTPPFVISPRARRGSRLRGWCSSGRRKLLAPGRRGSTRPESASSSWLFHQEENRESSQVQGRRSPLPPRPHGAAPGGAGGGHRRIGPRGGPHSFCSVGGRSCRSILASGGRLRERRRTTPLALLQQRRGAGVIFRDPTERAGASNSAPGSVWRGKLEFSPVSTAPSSASRRGCQLFR